MIKQLEVDGVPALLAPTDRPDARRAGFRVGLRRRDAGPRAASPTWSNTSRCTRSGWPTTTTTAPPASSTPTSTRRARRRTSSDFLNGVCAVAARPAAAPARPSRRKSCVPRQHSRGARRQRADGDVAARRPRLRPGRLPGVGPAPRSPPDDLRAWVARYFTRENAVLWVAGDAVPAGLQAGPARRHPAARAGAVVGAAGHAGLLPRRVAARWSGTPCVRRETAAAVFTGVLERAHVPGAAPGGRPVVHGGRPTTSRAATGTAVITAVADALPEKQGAVLGGFVDVLAALRVGRIDPAEVDRRDQPAGRCARSRPRTAARGCPGQAFDLLAGRDRCRIWTRRSPRPGGHRAPTSAGWPRRRTRPGC